MTPDTFNLLIWGWLALALVLLPVQLRITAPYGRHSSRKWGSVIDNRLGWVIMEAVSPLVFLMSLMWIAAPTAPAIWLLAGLYVAHYLHRSFIFPLRTRTRGKTIPVMIVVSAICFNTVNGWANGYYLGSGWADYSDWLADPRLWIGVGIFALGAAINIRADNALIALRSDGGSGYKIPRGGLFERVSCPNHLGEIIQWTGFAIACWNLPALAFAIWTAANLVPRAISHHRWYKDTFADYPRDRKALIPHLM